jgi:chromosome segregation ATPase
MNIKELIQKALKGEATDEEKTALLGFDPDSTAAAARKSEAEKRKQAEKERDELKAKIEEAQAEIDEAKNAGKSGAEKEKLQLEKTLKKLQDAEAKAAKSEAEFAEHRRNAKLDTFLNGLDFVDAKARAIARHDFVTRFKDIDEKGMEDESAVKPILDSVRGDYKSLLKDTSGHGGGSREKGSGNPIPSDDPAKQSDEERTKALVKLTR